MRVLVLSGFQSAWGQYSPDVLVRDDQMVGGGEAAMLMTSVGLSALGHDVTVCHVGKPGFWRGVRFHAQHRYEEILMARDDWDAVVSWSYQPALWSPAIPAKAVRILPQQLNDLWMGTVGVDAIVSPSWSHVEHLKTQIYPGDHVPDFHVSYSGVTCRYPEAYVWPRDPIVGYWSSPDRGLIHLLRVWPRVRASVPEAKLWIFYEIKRWMELCNGAYAIPDSYFGWYRHQAEIVKQLLADCVDLGVEVHGAKPRKVLAGYQQKCRLFCYPLDNGAGYVEGFCVAMLEALAAGCWPVVTPRDALGELYRDRGAGADWIGHGDEDALEDALVRRLTEPPPAEARDQNFELAAQYTWAAASQQLESAIQKTIEKKHHGNGASEAA